MGLFEEKGFQGTTIPEIAEAADVSPRTVSTYFPSKENMVFENWADQAGNLAESLGARASDESTTEAIRSWLLGEEEAWESRRDEMERHRRVIDSDECLRSFERARYHAFEQTLAGSIASDMDLDPGDLEPRLAAAALIAVFEVINEGRFDTDRSDTESRDQQQKVLDQALAFVAGGVAALSRGSRRR